MTLSTFSCWAMTRVGCTRNWYSKGILTSCWAFRWSNQGSLSINCSLLSTFYVNVAINIVKQGTRGAREIASAEIEWNVNFYEPEQSCKGMEKKIHGIYTCLWAFKAPARWIELKGFSNKTKKSHTENFNWNQISNESHIIKSPLWCKLRGFFSFISSFRINLPFLLAWHLSCINNCQPLYEVLKQVSRRQQVFYCFKKMRNIKLRRWRKFLFYFSRHFFIFSPLGKLLV